MKEFILGLFNLVTTFIMWLPFLSIRRAYIKIFSGGIGKNVYIGRNVDIRKPKNVFIGDNSVINKKVLLDGRGGILKIGKNVDIAQEVNIWTLTHDINDENHSAIGRGVVISSYSWIGARATIMPGVNIGEGSVVGTMSVVTKSIGAKLVVAGIPAKIIGERNNPLNYKFNYHPWFV